MRLGNPYNNKNSIGINYIYNLFYQLTILVVPLISMPYLSRTLGAEGIGVCSFIMSIATYFVLFQNLGIPTYGQLKIAENRDDVFEYSRLIWELLITRALLTCISVILFYISSVSFSGDQYIYKLHVIFLIASSLDLSWILQGFEEFKTVVIRNAIVKFLYLGSILLFVKSYHDLDKYLVLTFVTTLLGNITLVPFVLKNTRSVPFGSLRIGSHIKNCVMYFIPTVATTIYLSIDKTMIGIYSTTSVENGYYEQAHRIEQMLVTALTSLSVVTMPRIAYYYGHNMHDDINYCLKKTMTFISFLSLPMCFGLLGVSRELILLFLGASFEKSAVLLRILSVLLVIVGLNNAVGKQILISTEKQSKYNMSVVIGTIVNIILNLILIPRYYSIGAAFASVFSELLILICFIGFAKEYFSIRWYLKTSKKHFIGSMIMLVAILIIEKTGYSTFLILLLKILVGVAIYIVSLLIMKDKGLIELSCYICGKIKNFSSGV